MQEWDDLFSTSQDGLRLHARRYGASTAPKTPVVCLAGLTRNSADFHEIALALSAAGDRCVYAFDYRGRGLSDYDPNWQNYDLRIELADILDQLTAHSIAEAIFLGTSRGGILTMALPMARPAVLRGAILNDIGAVINGKGLARIRSYVGKLPAPRTYADAIAILKQISSSQFPGIHEAAWERMARRTWIERDGRLVPDYDIRLMKTLESLDFEQPLPTLWPQFESLRPVPVMVIRGEHSDILARETAQEMATRHPDCTVVEIPGEGHAPLLGDAETIARITHFVARI